MVFQVSRLISVSWRKVSSTNNRPKLTSSSGSFFPFQVPTLLFISRPGVARWLLPGVELAWGILSFGLVKIHNVQRESTTRSSGPPSFSELTSSLPSLCFTRRVQRSTSFGSSSVLSLSPPTQESTTCLDLGTEVSFLRFKIERDRNRLLTDSSSPNRFRVC